MEDFVPFLLAKKLKEKGFTCEYPFAMYTEYEQFCPLYTSDEYFFRIDDFGKHNYIAPTIFQVLKWLRDRNIHIEPFLVNAETVQYKLNIMGWNGKFFCSIYNSLLEDANNKTITTYQSYEQAVLAGIEYVIDNDLI